MGYSARYHAVSLVAVFIALAIGILIGAEFGGDTLSNTRRNLEESLVGNLQDARDRSEQLGGELNRSNEFAERVYPVLVRDQLDGRRIGLLAIGELPGDISDAVEDALGPTGARLVGVGVVREPVDVRGLAGDLSKTRFADIAENPDTQSAFGVGIGRQVVRGGTLVEKVRGHLFSRASGNFGALDGVIVVRIQPEEMGPKRTAVAGQLESGLMTGIVATKTPAVGVETSDSDDSSISFFQSNDLSSVDDVDLVAGRLATVFALLGAEGSFGVKSGADRLLPDLIVPPAGTGVAPAAPAHK
jgi:Copper transport outer membrane protein, MctB